MPHYDRRDAHLFRVGTVPDSPLAVLSSRVRETCVSAGLYEALLDALRARR